ncbi:CHAT domain-containing protein [Geodermatophilus obscurus]|uniref:CHAT domain-containing protein n=1 Tax=Geodermatophilus obscurus TaxID=1861 RepID=UPI00019B7678|nr:CHAT domain-containing protein [Geodermatophilus obscurus]
MASKDAELEIGLQWRPHDQRFNASLAFDGPADQEPRRQLVDQPVYVDLPRLRQLTANAEQYGTALTEMLFAVEEIGDFYRLARTAAGADDTPIHLRLLVDPSAPNDYHRVRWELLRDPEDGAPVATRRNVMFSRYLSSSDWTLSTSPPKHDLRALVVIANPSNLADYTPRGRSLAPVNVLAERQSAVIALGPSISVTVLDSGGAATLDRITDALADGIDLLYLVCHGTLADGDTRLWLEAPDGTAAVVDGQQLVDRLNGLTRRPTLAVLCSCQSAGTEPATEDGGVFAALGPRLAASGVPAVVAMQGNVTMTTAASFFPAFFEELAAHGVVDRAMAVARSRIEGRQDWWAPVLFSRLKRGRTWYLPGFAEAGSYLWNAVISAVESRTFTPILGPGLAAQIIGSRREIARRWVDRWMMPIAPANREDLPKVAQYLRTRTAEQVPANDLRNYLMTDFRQRYADRVPEALLQGSQPEKVIAELGAQTRRTDLDDPYVRVAALPAPIYVTTTWNSLLEDALVDAGRPPVVGSFDWNDAPVSDLSEELHEKPTVERPLVYHLFGRIEEPESLVLTEDDHFAWLMAWIDRRQNLPASVRHALTRKSLMFLGYRLDDLDFRVLFQSLQSFGGSGQLRRWQHIGVQLSPASPMIEPEAAQEYLESYFGERKVGIYWGETRRFLQELGQRMQVPQ